jgi:hypothetical protein
MRTAKPLAAYNLAKASPMTNVADILKVTVLASNKMISNDQG